MTFAERDRQYMNPYKLAALRDKGNPDEEDFEHLKGE